MGVSALGINHESDGEEPAAQSDDDEDYQSTEEISYDGKQSNEEPSSSEDDDSSDLSTEVLCILIVGPFVLFIFLCFCIGRYL